MAIQTTKDGKIKFRKYAAPITEYGDVEPRVNGHSHIPQPVTGPTPEPVTQEVSDIANNIAKEIAKQTDLRVSAVLEDGGKDEWIAWFQNEVEQWKQRAEELEIELEVMRNAFPEDDHDVLPKHRGIFGA
jgi:hypothetical protein